MFGFGPKMATINARELQARLEQGEKPLIVDVREDWEYREGHIPGSVLKPLMQIRNWMKDLPKDQEVVLVCRSGARSAQAYQFLAAQGFTNLKNMTGGMVTWRGAVAR